MSVSALATSPPRNFTNRGSRIPCPNTLNYVCVVIVYVLDIVVDVIVSCFGVVMLVLDHRRVVVANV